MTVSPACKEVSVNGPLFPARIPPDCQKVRSVTGSHRVYLGPPSHTPALFGPRAWLRWAGSGNAARFRKQYAE